VPILLQKSFSTADQNFSSPLVRFADKYVREKLTGDFANGLGAILNGEHSLASFLSKKSSRSIFGLLQQYLPKAAIKRANISSFPCFAIALVVKPSKALPPLRIAGRDGDKRGHDVTPLMQGWQRVCYVALS